MVMALKDPSALSSSFNCRTSLKNLKIELKLIQEVSSCLSVPAREKTDTRRQKSWVHCVQTGRVSEDCEKVATLTNEQIPVSLSEVDFTE